MITVANRRHGPDAIVVWTPERDAVIRARYFTEPAGRIATDLGVTRAAVFHRAHRLGLLKNRPWTDKANAELRDLWGEMSIPQLAAHLGRTEATIYRQGQILGLTSKAPQGLEYLTTAADRTGYDTGQIRAILKWARVRIRPAMGRPRLKRTTDRRYSLVDPYEVNEAVEKWLATEPLEAAARARGVGREFLVRRLRLVPGTPKRPGGKKHWRIPTEVLDRALATKLPKPNRPRGHHGYYTRKAAA